MARYKIVFEILVLTLGLALGFGRDAQASVPSLKEKGHKHSVFKQKISKPKKVVRFHGTKKVAIKRIHSRMVKLNVEHIRAIPYKHARSRLAKNRSPSRFM